MGRRHPGGVHGDGHRPDAGENACAVIAVAEQESGLRTDPVVPGLPKIAWEEIDRRAEQVGVPRLLVRAALQLRSPTGASFSERIDGVKTEKDLSDVFDDFIGMVPMGNRLVRRREPGAHARTDAGPDRLRRAPCRRAPLSVSGQGPHRRRTLHASRRHVLRRGPPARLPGLLRPPPLPLRRLQRRPVREPQRRVPDCVERRFGHAARARRRAAAARRRPARGREHRARGARRRQAARRRRRRPSGGRWNRGAVRRSNSRRSTRGCLRWPIGWRGAGCRGRWCRGSISRARRSSGR